VGDEWRSLCLHCDGDYDTVWLVQRVHELVHKLVMEVMYRSIEVYFVLCNTISLIITINAHESSSHIEHVKKASSTVVQQYSHYQAIITNACQILVMNNSFELQVEGNFKLTL
jgi:hypothetical protein